VQKLLSSHALVERLKLQLADIREELRRKEAQLEGLQRRSKAAARERAAVNADWQRVMELEESDARVAAEIERKTTEVDATAGRIAKLQSKQAVEQRKLEAMQKELQEVHRASKESLPMDLAKKRVSVLRLKTDALKAQVIDAEAAAEERALKQQEALTSQWRWDLYAMRLREHSPPWRWLQRSEDPWKRSMTDERASRRSVSSSSLQ